jgi:hypothetical protein
VIGTLTNTHVSAANTASFAVTRNDTWSGLLTIETGPAHYCYSADILRPFCKIGRSARIRGMVAAAVNAAATIPTVRLE